jgi:NAD(P)H dehydrogenase (quinone)
VAKFIAMKNILIINGHPDKQSFNHALAAAYREGLAHTKTTVEQINIGDLQFDPNLRYGYRQRTELEPDLLAAIQNIQAADHLVWVFPMWWYGCPALMKGFIDRTFLPGIAFEHVPGKALPKKLLTGKTARIIVTADTPRWYDRWFMGGPVINQLKKGTLEFCGIGPVKTTYIAVVKGSSDLWREKWLEQIRKLGAVAG